MKKIKGLIVLFFILIFLQFILWVQSPSEVIVSFLKYYSCSIYLFCDFFCCCDVVGCFMDGIHIHRTISYDGCGYDS